MLKTSHMQELKRRYSSMYAPQEQEVEEAVLIDRDYEYDGKVIKISKKNFSKVSNDYKNSTKGKERMITYDSKWGTVSVPVEFTEEVEIDEMKSSSGYELYHKDFSSAMQHAYAFAKKKGNTIDPKEIDDKVATGPKKPSKGKTNRYALKAGKKLAHIQVANLDDKKYELNMYFDKEYKGKFEEVEIEEAKEFWAVIDKAKGGEVMAVSSDEKGAKSSVKMSNFSKHDYHFGKDPRTLKIVKVAGNYKQGEKMIGTKLSFKEEVEVDESNELQAIMALDDAGIEATINKKDQVVIKKKDLKKAEKALKKSFKKGGAPELHTEEVEIDEAVNLKKLKKEYEKNEDDNYHRENYLLLAKAFGTKSEIKKVEEIMKRSEANNSTSQKDNDWMYKNIMPYYNKIRNEEVEIGEKIEKESYGSFITAAAKAKKEGKKTFMMGGKKYPVTIKQKISAAYEEAEVEEAKLYAAKGTAYPATIDTLKMIVKDKQNQTIMFKDGKAMVDLFTASAMTQVYDALKKPEIKKSFEKMILDKAGFLKAQGFAMKMISGR